MISIEKNHVSLTEAGVLLGVSTNKVRRFIDSGELKCHQTTGKCKYKILVNDLKELVFKKGLKPLNEQLEIPDEKEYQKKELAEEVKQRIPRSIEVYLKSKKIVIGDKEFPLVWSFE